MKAPTAQIREVHDGGVGESVDLTRTPTENLFELQSDKGSCRGGPEDEMKQTPSVPRTTQNGGRGGKGG